MPNADVLQRFAECIEWKVDGASAVACFRKDCSALCGSTIAVSANKISDINMIPVPRCSTCLICIRRWPRSNAFSMASAASL